MTTLANLPNTALLIVDVQRGVVEGNYQRNAVVGNIRTLVERSRAQSVPVVWVQDTGEDREQGSDPWQIVPELSPADDEARVQKN